MSKVYLGIFAVAVVAVFLFFTGVYYAFGGKDPSPDGRYNLPSDFDSVVSISDAHNGLLFSYISKNGTIKTIQYVGENTDPSYTYIFRENKR